MQWERERALSQRLITLDDQTSHQVRGEGESSQWMEGRADGRSGTPALVRLPLSMPNDELVLTRRTDQRRTERGEDIQTPLHRLPGKIIYRQLPYPPPSPVRGVLTYYSIEAVWYHGLLPASVSLSLSHERDGRFPGSFIVVQPKFPIHYVDTLAPAAAFAPRHASRLCNYAFRRARSPTKSPSPITVLRYSALTPRAERPRGGLS